MFPDFSETIELLALAYRRKRSYLKVPVLKKPAHTCIGCKWGNIRKASTEFWLFRSLEGVSPNGALRSLSHYHVNVKMWQFVNSVLDKLDCDERPLPSNFPTPCEGTRTEFGGDLRSRDIPRIFMALRCASAIYSLSSIIIEWIWTQNQAVYSIVL